MAYLSLIDLTPDVDNTVQIHTNGRQFVIRKIQGNTSPDALILDLSISHADLESFDSMYLSGTKITVNETARFQALISIF